MSSAVLLLLTSVTGDPIWIAPPQVEYVTGQVTDCPSGTQTKLRFTSGNIACVTEFPKDVVEKLGRAR
jgi:hypothetical protein